MPPHINSSTSSTTTLVVESIENLDKQHNDLIIRQRLPTKGIQDCNSLSSSQWTTETEASATQKKNSQAPFHRISYCHHSHLPPWLQDNDFIRTQHRPPLNSYRQCLKSIFSIHSETGNIWSHLIGFKLYLSLACSFWNSIEISQEEKLVFSSFFIGVIVCMGFSTLFHTFCCHSQKVGGFFIRLDYCGISILIMAGFFPWIYYGFYCETTIRNIYATLSIVTGTICLISSFTKVMSDPESRTLRTTIFTSCGLVYLIPAGHFLWINGLDHPITQSSFLWLSRVTMICLLKAVIYSCRLPERWFPGRCDIWFHSHQIFHVLVVVATLVNYLGVRELSMYRYAQSAAADGLGNVCSLSL